MKYVLGVDQGGSHTWAVVCSQEGDLISLGCSFGACQSYDGMDRAVLAVKNACTEAMLSAQINPGQVEMLLGGITGADWPDEYLNLQRQIRLLELADHVEIVNDSMIALRGGTRAQFGVVLIAGSGGNCAVVAPDGREFIYGYYQEPGLQGGGALSHHVLAAVYRSATGREEETELTNRVLDYYGFPEVDALLRADVENRLPSIAGLVPVLFQVAQAGDLVALKILRLFGEGSAELIIAGLKRFEMMDLEVDIVLSGGVFKSQTTQLVNVISTNLQHAAPKARLVQARYEPVVGAALLGLGKSNIRLVDSIWKKIDQSAQRLDLVRSDTLLIY